MRIKPREVFTPRNSEVNDEMYVSRTELEQDFVDAIFGSNNILIHGESGTGKSWLYKHTLKKEGIKYCVTNMSNASRLNGLDAELKNVVNREYPAIKTGYEEEKTAGINAVVASGKLTHKRIYELKGKEPFEACLELLKSESNGKLSCLIFDNFEQILGQTEIVRDVGNCIILLDDARYSQYKVKIILVGVPNGVERYFTLQSNVATIVNRITEVPEVTKLTESESKQLILRGFKEKLRYNCNNYDELSEKISFVTGRIPQQIQEFCLAIAREVERTKKSTITNTAVLKGAAKWFKQSLSGSFSVIDSLLKFDEETDINTRILYVIGRYQGDEINPDFIIGLFQSHFPQYSSKLVKDKAGLKINEIIDVGSYLKSISEKDPPIIRLAPNKKTYRFIRPQYQMCLRMLLELDQFENIRKVDHDEIMEQINSPYKSNQG